jgi:hypothetical protein
MPILQARLANLTVSADGEFVQVPLAPIMCKFLKELKV